jgi:hypothetical protein
MIVLADGGIEPPHFYITQEEMERALVHYTGWTDHPGSVSANMPALQMPPLPTPRLPMPTVSTPTTVSASATTGVPETDGSFFLFLSCCDII